MGIIQTDTFGERFEQLKKARLGAPILDISKYEVAAGSYLIKPAFTKSWEELEKSISDLVDYSGLMKTVRELFDQGHGAEIETTAELARTLATYKKPSHYFAASISKKAGNWEKVTLKKVREVWEARRNALTVMEKLNLDPSSMKQILALSWRLKRRLLQYLSMATAKDEKINNSQALFFWLTSQKLQT